MIWKKILDFTIRNAIWLGLIVLGLIFLQPTFDTLNKLTLIVVLEAMAMGLSGIALFVFTHVKFTKNLAYGNDGKLNTWEQRALLSFAGQIFIGVHVLVGIAYYILQLEVVP